MKGSWASCVGGTTLSASRSAFTMSLPLSFPSGLSSAMSSAVLPPSRRPFHEALPTEQVRNKSGTTSLLQWITACAQRCGIGGTFLVLDRGVHPLGKQRFHDSKLVLFHGHVQRGVTSIGPTFPRSYTHKTNQGPPPFRSGSQLARSAVVSRGPCVSLLFTSASWARSAFTI